MDLINVVIAEDDFRIAQIHEEFLSHIKGFNVIGKSLNAKETMELLNNHTVDLLLMDIYMPDQLGIDLLSEIRENYPTLDVILITAAREKEFLNKALKFGVEHYLIKPVTLEVFIKTIEKYKENRHLLNSITEINQDIIDHFFAMDDKKKAQQKIDFPAGIDYLTLEKVSNILKTEKTGLTADKVGDKMGASRTTARRYLEYLVSIKQAYVEQVYGVVGRPERNYFYNELLKEGRA
ncbi:response regulator [Ureibacillus chungkukjangi]|uniref:Transcriptional regulatory protein n=1 Tax=Ureibacillus chungkukjangi TaxID=1202712 RepID=A0A318TSU6_9BACL|nr:response regulator [Ureibacillus chungkukjangi]PYF07926.1 response regulator of citrate/malate metabolism [Ureibacillus chungkukjangi]